VHRLQDVPARPRLLDHQRQVPFQVPHPLQRPRRLPVARRLCPDARVQHQRPHPAQLPPRRRRQRLGVRERRLPRARPLPELRLRRRSPAPWPDRRHLLPVLRRRLSSLARRPQRRRPTGRNTPRRQLRRPSGPRRRSQHRCRRRRVRPSVT
jgi:hypothetical protein